jgi:hypothetical protein
MSVLEKQGVRLCAAASPVSDTRFLNPDTLGHQSQKPWQFRSVEPERNVAKRRSTKQKAV